MDSKDRIKKYIENNFPNWEKIDYANFCERVDFKKDFSELYKIDNDEIILISYTNISITGSERPKPQLRVFLDEYKKPFYFAKKNQLRFFLFSIFTKEDEMAKGLDNFNPKEYVISIETNFDSEGSRRDLRSIYDYANEHLNGKNFLKCTRSNYNADINQATFIYIGSEANPEKTYFENFINFFDSRPYMNSSSTQCIDVIKTKIKQPFQQIFYGAPGTGKSHAINEITSKYPDTIRTTFHPDSDYSTFVGAYKPTMTKERKSVVIGQDEKEVVPLECNSKWAYKITYKFVKQAFLKAYVKAWKKFRDTYMDGVELTPQFLVIEEINRGNCAQIFGDLFQLLDRKENFSEYPIEADADICKALLEEDTEDNPSFGVEGLQLSEKQVEYINSVFDKEGEGSQRVAEKICKGQVLVLPSNFYIWATMNTSDQSLFPIDSAFKRRWAWKYVRISEGKTKNKQPLNFRIKFNVSDTEEEDVSWWEFIQAINTKIEDATKSEDKKLGYFFCKPDKKADGAGENDENTIISAEIFVGKVVSYLWQDVFKDYGFKSDIFKKDDGKRLSFHDFYPDDKEPDDKNPEAIDLNLVKRFIDRVMIKKPAETPAPPQAEDPIE